MRVSTKKTFNAWVSGQSYRKAGPNGAAIWTDGINIYSYNTLIAKCIADKVVLFNDSRYSKTTTTHQNGLRCILTEGGFTVLSMYPQE